MNYTDLVSYHQRKTFVWILDNSILAVVKAENEANAWEILKDTNIGIYDKLTSYTNGVGFTSQITRPQILEECTNNCICFEEGYEFNTY